MSVRVAVRCRPFNERERQLGAESVVSMQGDSTFLRSPEDDKDVRTFTFDHSFWSHDPADDHFASQEHVYNCIGSQLLQDVFDGYNACLFAYGQTGSGKSFSMMGVHGNNEERGIIPRFCEDLFKRISTIEKTPGTNATWAAKVEISYMEIYLERVRDLLMLNSESTGYLRVREHVSTGPYVQGLSSHAVTSFETVKELMEEGNKMRTVRATSMNDVSSRSHAIFQINFTQTQLQERNGQTIKLDRVSKLCLVDLAGSERSGAINAGKGERLKEGNVINKSLSTLGKVISTLAERSKSSKKQHVPYRDSVLTWLLKESLGGNSKTIMLAAISPAQVNYEETLSTLRYANQAKNIVNIAVVNEDSKATVVRQLKEEIEQLRAQLSLAQSSSASETGPIMDETAMMQQLEETEKLLAELSKSWEDKLQQTLEMQSLRSAELRAHGIVMGDDDDEMAGPVGVMAPNKIPYLVNLSRNTFAHENAQQCLVYYIKEGFTPVNRYDESVDTMRTRGISLPGDETVTEYCVFHCFPDEESGLLMVTLIPSEGPDIAVNSKRLKGPVRLRSGDMIAIGKLNVFRFDNPEDFLSPSSSMLTSSTSSPVRSPSPHGSGGSVSGSVAGSVAGSVVGSIAGSTVSVPNTGGISGGPSSSAQSMGNVPLPLTSEEEVEIKSMQERAQFAYELGEETALLEKVCSMDPDTMEFKLLPAYGCYMMLRFCYNVYALEDLYDLLTLISSLFSKARLRADHPKAMAFWMANTVELLMSLRADATLCEQATEAQVVADLTQMVEDSYAAFVRKALDMVRPALPAVLEDDFMQAVVSKPEGGTVEVQLGNLLKLLKQMMLNQNVLEQLFAAIFFRVGATLFNMFITRPALFECNAGLSIRFNLSKLTEWARRQNMDIEPHLQHVIQASQLLQTNKASLDNLGTLSEACTALNSLQLKHLLGSYKPAKGEGPVPADLTSCITAMAKVKADKVDQEDERAGCCVQLERNATHLLPFRLSGDFHMNHGLADKNMVAFVQTQLACIMSPSVHQSPVAMPPTTQAPRCTAGVRLFFDSQHLIAHP